MDLTALKKQRDVLITQLSLMDNKLSGVTTLRSSEANTRLGILDTYWKTFDALQKEIEGTTDRNDLEDEMRLRFRFDEVYIKIRTKIIEFRDQFELMSATDAMDAAEFNKWPAYTIEPLQENEYLTDFLSRFQEMTADQEYIEPKLRLYMMLSSLTPMVYRRVYDQCCPERHPIELGYEELIQMLEEHINIDDNNLKQLPFGTVQQEDELVTAYADLLKALACDYKLNCSNCGSSLIDQYVLMQFINGLRDPDVREGVLNADEELSLSGAIDIALQIEVSKRDEQRTQRIGHERQKEYERFNEMMKGKCFRCGSDEHRANECEHADTLCDYCRRVGHLENACRRKAKSLWRTSLEEVVPLEDVVPPNDSTDDDSDYLGDIFDQ